MCVTQVQPKGVGQGAPGRAHICGRPSGPHQRLPGRGPVRLICSLPCWQAHAASLAVSASCAAGMCTLLTGCFASCTAVLHMLLARLYPPALLLDSGIFSTTANFASWLCQQAPCYFMLVAHFRARPSRLVRGLMVWTSCKLLPKRRLAEQPSSPAEGACSISSPGMWTQPLSSCWPTSRSWL